MLSRSLRACVWVCAYLADIVVTKDWDLRRVLLRWYTPICSLRRLLPGCLLPGCLLPGCLFPGCLFPGCLHLRSTHVPGDTAVCKHFSIKRFCGIIILLFRSEKRDIFSRSVNHTIMQWHRISMFCCDEKSLAISWPTVKNKKSEPCASLKVESKNGAFNTRQ